ncbi:OprO/OprP family phosphate-selective porin [Limnobacter sp.]|uniref:OprO/OprP family phosphate-selective porin n=1 Tax=Limnobacter sp. TaxID=2003368 RepID=UPI003748CBFC
MKISSCSVLALLMLGAISINVQAGQVRTDGQDIILSTKGGLKLETEDKSAGFQIGGRLHWDYTQDESDTVANGNQTLEDFDARRARIALRGYVNDFEYKAEFNIAESGSGGSVEDLYVKYKGFGDMANLTIGKQRVPLGLEVLTSSNDISLLERSAMTERYTLERSAGIKLSGRGLDKRFTYGVGLFEADGNGTNDFQEQALAGRVTFAPIMTKTSLLHLGVGYQNVGATDPLEEADNMNVEVAGAFGPLHAQAEYFDSDVGPQNFSGYYAQVGYVLNGGGSRPYSDGIFKRVKALPGGTWEVVARYEDGDGRFSDIGLGAIDAEQTTLGVNYYMNDSVKIGMSYMDGDSNTNSDTGNELRMRLQFTY